jgi:phosphomannomutase
MSAGQVSIKNRHIGQPHAWHFNLRASNTEPLLRLNVESRGDPVLMERH